MKIGGLYLFEKTNMRGQRIIAWHNPKSITWLWSIWIGISEVKKKWKFYKYRTNYGLQWGIYTPYLSLKWLKQKSMWRKECQMKRSTSV